MAPYMAPFARSALMRNAVYIHSTMPTIELSIWRVTDERGRRRVTDWLMTEYEARRQYPNCVPECISYTTVVVETPDHPHTAIAPHYRSRAVRGPGEPMRLLVCGGRDYRDQIRAWAALDRLLAKRPIEVLIHGGATGADTLADEWAQARGIQRRVFAVTRDQWRELGRIAGPLRNSKMLREGEPDGVVAFPGGRGTADMIRQAESWGLRVWQPYPVRRLKKGSETPARPAEPVARP